ncbi:MAG TPA: hypothetical protein DEP84_07300, partial [Chloroflexi bacterium]|nr:hypothetical protein [Chloroflexota bacterium]
MSFTWRRPTPQRARALAPHGANTDLRGRHLATFACRRWSDLPLLATWSLVLAYALFFGMLTVRRHEAFLTSAFDLGNYDQALWNTAHGHPFALTNIAGVTTRLAHHVEPILLLIAPLYWLWSDPRLLLWLQSMVVALGALPLFWFSRRRVGAWPSVVLAAVYLLSPALEGANLFDFHAVTLAPTFLLLALNWLDEQRDGPFLAAALLALGTKEEIGLIVALMGLYALLIQRRRFGWLPLLVGAGWSTLAIGVILPHFNPTGQPEHIGRYGALGKGLGDVLVTLVRRPWTPVALLVEPDRFRYLAGLLLPLAGLPLLAPEVLLLAAPSLAINLLSDYAPMHTLVGYHYPAPIIPFAIAAAAVGVSRLARGLEGARPLVPSLGTRRGGIPERREQPGSFLEGAPAHDAPSPALRATLPSPSLNDVDEASARSFNLPTFNLLTLFVLLASLVAQVRSGATPLAAGFTWPAVTEHHRVGEAVIAAIPPNAAVSAGWRLNPHVSERRRVYQFPDVREADLVLLDVTMLDLFMHPNDLHAQVETLLAQGWGVAAGTDGWLLLQRGTVANGQPPDGLPPEFYSFARLKAPPRPEFAMQADFSDTVRLLGYDFAQTVDGPRLTIYWTALRPPAEASGSEPRLRLWPLFLDPRDGHVLEDTSLRPLIETLWYPLERWQPGEIVRTTTIPWQFGSDYTVAVAVRADGESTSWLQPRILSSDVVPELVHEGKAIKLLDVRANRPVPARRLVRPP